MIPEIGKRVRVLFRNGMGIDGIVEEWFGNYAQLKSTSDESTIIITNPTQDIMVIKILPDEIPEEITEPQEPVIIPMGREPRSPAEVFRNPPKFSSDTPADEFARVLEDIPDPTSDARNKSLAELKIMMNEQEKKIIAQKLKTHIPSGYVPHKPNYGTRMDLLPRGKRRR